MSEKVAQWAIRLHTAELTNDLVSIMLDVPESARKQIIESVTVNSDSPIKLCADSIIRYSTPIFRDGRRHFVTGTDSLLALVPQFAKTYCDFDVNFSRLPHETLQAVLSNLSRAEDTPSNFLYDPIREGHLTTTIHGMIIATLIGHYGDSDYKWLGENRKQLIPLATTLYEREALTREFIEQLMEHSVPIANGTL